MGYWVQMGEKQMIQKASLKFQTITTFILIIFLSAICTVITVVGYLLLAFNSNKPMLRTANYYEKEAIKIENYIESNGETLIDYNSKQKLDKIIPYEGIKYQIIDNEGRILYGTTDERLIKNKRDLITWINKTYRDKDGIFQSQVRKYIPIISVDGELKGAAVLVYNIKTSTVNKKNENIVLLIETFVIFSPFIFFGIFTTIFTKRFIKGIQGPIDEIIAASNKIKEKDLEFDINYKSNNELGKLVSSFEDMKNALKESLYNQWVMEEDRKEMIKAIAHDLKTPITVIQGHVEVLMEGGMENPIRLEKYLNIIKSNAERMSRLIEDMNTVSEIERQDFKLNPEKIDVVEFLKNKEEDYKVLSKSKGIEFVLNIEYQRTIKNEFSIDVQRVEQILDNIISNAIRYTAEGKSINISVKINSNFLDFTVEDEGRGFAEKDLPYIFNKFYRGDAARSIEKGHSGLGLYIVKTIVEKHNGWIKAENRENGGGAKVRFIIKEI